MIYGELANLIKEKVNYTRLLISLFIIGLIGIVLQSFEGYTMFWIMFPVLLVMLTSVILILKFCLKELEKFHEICTENDIKIYCTMLLTAKDNSLLISAYILMVFVYIGCTL